MATTLHERTASGSQPRRPAPEPGRRALLVVVIVAFAAVVGTIAFLVGRNSDEPAATTTTVAAPTTTAVPTTQPPTTAAPTTAPAIDTSTAVWPTSQSGVLYTDPVAAARGFAVDFVGFTDPVVGPFMQGDTRSGEVEIRPVAQGPVTTVLVRQLSGSENWSVLGTATANIQVDEPAALSVVTSPAHLAGTSTAFEANVGVAVFQDGSLEPIGTGYVMGGSMGELAPFDGTVTFATPTAEYGAIVFFTQSMENGQMWEASVLRIRFASA